MKPFILLIAAAFSFDRCFACSCQTIPFDEELKQTHAIFVGRCISKTYIRERLTCEYVFEVERAWKTALAKRLTISSDAFGSACGYSFVPKHRYVVWTNEQGADKKLWTTICDRTCEADSKDAAAQQKRLGKALVEHLIAK
jgi:hypothetical protein